MKRVALVGFLFIIFICFYAHEEPSRLSFGAQQENIFVQNKYNCTRTTSNSSTDQWAKTYGGTGKDSCAEHLPFQETSDGGYIVLGTTQSFGPGGEDIWILKLDSSGGIEWQRTYGGTDFDGKPYIQEAGDGGYIVAASTESFGAGGGDAWILKLDSSGGIEWQRTYGGDLFEGYCHLQLTNDGGYIVANSTRSFGAGGGDIWVLKLNSFGDIEWQRAYGGIYDDWNTDIKLTSDGGYIVSGTTREFGSYGNSLVLKLNSSGDVEWQRAYGGGFMDYPGSIQQTVDGGYIVAGYTESFDQQNRWLDASVIKLSSSGDIEWEEAYGGAVDELAWSIQQTSDGGYVVAGESYPVSGEDWEAYGAGGEDLLVLKIGLNGDIFDCGLQGSPANSVNELSWSSSDTNVTPMNTNVIPQDTNIQPQESDAIVHNVCPGPHTLTLSATSGGTTDPEPGIYTYGGGIYVTIKANPDSGYEFTGWADYAFTGNPIISFSSLLIIAMDSDKSRTAIFAQVPSDPVPSDDDGGGGGGGCFIATACYGTPLAEEVKILSAFRDRYLITNPIGYSLVKLYYNHSPKMADFIRDKEDLKIIIRACLKPVVWIISKILSRK